MAVAMNNISAPLCTRSSPIIVNDNQSYKKSYATFAQGCCGCIGLLFDQLSGSYVLQCHTTQNHKPHPGSSAIQWRMAECLDDLSDSTYTWPLFVFAISSFIQTSCNPRYLLWYNGQFLRCMSRTASKPLWVIPAQSNCQRSGNFFSWSLSRGSHTSATQAESRHQDCTTVARTSSDHSKAIWDRWLNSWSDD